VDNISGRSVSMMIVGKGENESRELHPVKKGGCMCVKNSISVSVPIILPSYHCCIIGGGVLMYSHDGKHLMTA